MFLAANLQSGAGRGLRRTGRVALEREDEQEPDPDADGAVGNVKGRKAGLLSVAADDVKAEKVDDMADTDSIEEIAENAAKDEPERKLAAESVDIEVVTGQEQDDERSERRGGEDRIVATEHAPGGTGVAPMHELKKTFDDDALLVKTEVFQHEQLRDLVGHENREGKNGDTPGGVQLCHQLNG